MTEFLRRFHSVMRYELLWHIRKKKVLAILILVFVFATLSVFLPPILDLIYDRPIDANPNSLINAGIPLGELGFVLLAIVLAMNSISGEFESGTITPLLTKPVSRTMIFFGKTASAFLILLITYLLLIVYLAIGNFIVYGPQNNFHLTPLLLIGGLISTFVYIGIVLAFGASTKSSILAVFGVLGVVLILNIGVGIFASLSGGEWIQTYFPGDGRTGFIEIGDSNQSTPGPTVQTGTNGISDNLILLIQYPNANVNFRQSGFGGPGRFGANESNSTQPNPDNPDEILSETLTYITIRSLIVAFSYIIISFLISLVFLVKAQIKE